MTTLRLILQTITTFQIMSNGISGVGGFGTYTITNSALQFILGIGKRKDNEIQQLEKENFEQELIRAKEEFSDEMEAEKLALTRAKMKVARQYKAIEAKRSNGTYAKATTVSKVPERRLPDKAGYA